MRAVSTVETASPVLDRSEVARAVKGVLIVVGGHSRGVGKTTTIEQILRERHLGRWAAVKVSAHRHCEPHETAPLVERDLVADPDTQTGRYLIAGAERAFLCRTAAAHLSATADFIRALRTGGLNLIVESNRIVDFVEPDVVLFTVAPRIADWKASSGVALPRTHAFVIRDDNESDAMEAVRALAAKGRIGFAPAHGDELARFQAWLSNRLPAAVRDEPRAHATVN